MGVCAEEGRGLGGVDEGCGELACLVDAEGAVEELLLLGAEGAVAFCAVLRVEG